jgi:cytochrome c oxidase subunit I
LQHAGALFAALVIVFPQHFPDYPADVRDVEQYLLDWGVLVRLVVHFYPYILFNAIRRGAPAPQNPWDRADSLEWTCPPTAAPY